MLDRAIASWWDRFDDATDRAGTRCDWSRGDLLWRNLPLAPGRGRVSPNGHCCLLEGADGWLALNLARPDDRSAISAWLEDDVSGDDLDAIAARTASRPVGHWRERAELLHMPVGIAGETAPRAPMLLHEGESSSGASLAGLRVLDLSALWAGPLCGALLAGSGADVLRVEDPRRPDPTAQTSPAHAKRLNDGKRLASLQISADSLGHYLADCDVLITSARPQALARLGITPDSLLSRHPNILWIAITAYGWQLPGGSRVGFGDDCAAAGGLLAWEADEPRFMGDALADPLTGLVAATAAVEAIGERRRGLLDCALAPTAALITREISP